MFFMTLNYVGVENEIKWFVKNSNSEELRSMEEKNRAYLVENLTETVSVEKYKRAILNI